MTAAHNRTTVAAVLRAMHACFANEDELQQAVAIALNAAGITHFREHRLVRGGRIDFLTTTGVGIECKILGSAASIGRQLLGYVEAAECSDGVVLVTTKRTHEVYNLGLPITVVVLSGGLA